MYTGGGGGGGGGLCTIGTCILLLKLGSNEGMCEGCDGNIKL